MRIFLTRVSRAEVTRRSAKDYLATEEPLEIRLLAGDDTRTLAVTMRTPGNDFELAAGFLLAEGVIGSRDDVKGITYCVDPEVDAEQRYNIVNVALRQPDLPDLAGLERHFFTSSACGVCGRAGLDSLETKGLAPLVSGTVAAEVISSLPDKLRAAQGLFAVTGGLHAAALFTRAGELLAVREDVGRHNALDKLIGWALLEARLPLTDCVLLVSGRASYELVQKALVAGLPTLCAVSAPSSLAVDLAKRFNLILIGFLREASFNIYVGAESIQFASDLQTAN